MNGNVSLSERENSREDHIWEQGLKYCCFPAAHPSSSSHKTFRIDRFPWLLSWHNSPCCMAGCFYPHCSLFSVLPTLAHPSGITANVSSSGCLSDSWRCCWGFILELPQHLSHISITELHMWSVSATQGKLPRTEIMLYFFFFFSCGIMSETKMATQQIFSFTLSILAAYHI